MAQNAFHISLGTILRTLGVLVLVGVIVMYVHFQARNILSGPTIVFYEEHSPLQTEQLLTLSGKATNIVKLTLNGREIHTDEQGSFVQGLVLENGYTIVTLTAWDRFGRETTLTRTYVYVGQG